MNNIKNSSNKFVLMLRPMGLAQDEMHTHTHHTFQMIITQIKWPTFCQNTYEKKKLRQKLAALCSMMT